MTLENRKNMDVFSRLSEASDIDAAEKTVLIADDETDILYALQLILLAEGYRVLTCVNGRDAWALVQEHQPDLVLTDIMMPYLSGIELLHKIRNEQKTQDIPVILMSCIKPSDGRAADTRNAYISKPFLLDKLLERIRSFLDEPTHTVEPSCDIKEQFVLQP